VTDFLFFIIAILLKTALFLRIINAELKLKMVLRLLAAGVIGLFALLFCSIIFRPLFLGIAILFPDTPLTFILLSIAFCIAAILLVTLIEIGVNRHLITDYSQQKITRTTILVNVVVYGIPLIAGWLFLS
jgi:hypothetical protein